LLIADYLLSLVLDSPPIEPLSGSSSPPLIWHKPDWNFWKRKTKIKLWEAAFLCCDIDPRNQHYRDIKGRHYEKVDIYLNLLKDNLNRLDFDFVSPHDVAEWALNRDLDIPPELAELAKKPEADTTTNQSIRYDENRNFLKERIDEGLTNFEAIWSHMRKNAGEPTYLFKSVGNSFATKVNEEKTYKTDLNRQYRALLKKLKETENP